MLSVEDLDPVRRAALGQRLVERVDLLEVEVLAAGGGIDSERQLDPAEVLRQAAAGEEHPGDPAPHDDDISRQFRHAGNLGRNTASGLHGLVPADLPATRWDFPPPDQWPGDDVIAFGADLEPDTLIAAYRLGLFPMAIEGRLAWWSPMQRAVLPVAGLRVSRSLRRSVRRFRLTLDLAFEEVVAGCADRPDIWIDPAMAAAYRRLHELGWAHSVESWSEGGELAGGLYGVAIGSLFAGESMFHRQTDASKVALTGLVGIMSKVAAPVLDVQWATPHLASLGAVVVGRRPYLQMLREAVAGPDPFAGLDPGPIRRSCVPGSAHSPAG